MKVYLDDQPLAVDTGTLGGALKAIRAAAGGRLVVELLADGRPVADADMDAPPLRHPYASELRATSADPADLASAALREAEGQLRSQDAGRARAADLIQSGRTTEALESLSGVLGAWDTAHRTPEQCWGLTDPTLRERLEDIPALVKHLVQRAATRFGLPAVQPAAGDAGGAYGAAMVAYHMFCGKERTPVAAGEIDRMKGSYLGPEFDQQDIEKELRKAGARFKVLTEDQMIDACAEGLEKEKAIGWFQGRMEFGPRALGARSILGDPRSPKTQSVLNLKVKYRESFRPFAPSVLREDLKEWFALDEDSPYMLVVADVAKNRQKAMTAEQEKLFGIAKLNVPRSEIPAVTHVDYSARIQTVHKETNPRYHRLISRFKERTGCPVVVNTSFNVRGEPIVCTPSDAFRCFMGTELDMLAVGNCLLVKEEQDQALALDYKNRFELD
jgi:hypothetical protein